MPLITFRISHRVFLVCILFSHKSSLSPFPRRRPLFAFYLYHVETLYDIADLDVVIVFYADTAFISLVDFFDIVFEPPSEMRSGLRGYDTASYQSDLGIADDFAFLYIGSLPRCPH